MIRLAALNSVYQTGLRSPMDEAILRHEHPAVARYTRVDEIPFDFQRRRVSVIVQDGGRRLLITKGAPESVLPAARRPSWTARPRRSTRRRGRRDGLFHRLSADGYRALAVAYRVVDEQPAYRSPTSASSSSSASPPSSTRRTRASPRPCARSGPTGSR